MQTLNLYQKINAIYKKVKSVNKGSTVRINDRSSYTAVSHDDVTSLLHDPLADMGIIAFPNMESAEMESFETEKEYQGKVTVSISYRVKIWASVTFINCDAPEEKLVTKCFSYALDSGDKATGKAYSMAVKYCYLKAFMLESMDEEESRDFERDHTPAPQRNSVAPREYQAPTTDKPASEAQIARVKKEYPDMNVTGLTMKRASELIQQATKGK
jgi:hypothetical protein